jgi:hypothetical protein
MKWIAYLVWNVPTVMVKTILWRYPLAHSGEPPKRARESVRVRLARRLPIRREMRNG